jgi:hypothetical protein
MLDLTCNQIEKELKIRLAKYGFFAEFKPSTQKKNVLGKRTCYIIGEKKKKVFVYVYKYKTKKISETPLILPAKYNDPKKAVLNKRRLSPNSWGKPLEISKIGNSSEDVFNYIVFLLLQILEEKQISFDTNLSDLDTVEEIQEQIKSGAGFGNSIENKKVENAAINFVTSKYITEGWSVESKEKYKLGFDLHCKKGNLIEKVEVKGIKGLKISFIITARELELSRNDNNFVLCVVNNALTKNKILSKYSSKEFINNFTNKAIVYKSTIKS